MKPKKKFRSTKHFIIQRLVKPENHKQKGFWPKEMKILNTLLCKYPNEYFWARFNLGFELNSLAWFLTKDGNQLVSEKLREFNLDFTRKNEIILDSDNSVYFKPLDLEIDEKKFKTTKQLLK